MRVREQSLRGPRRIARGAVEAVEERAAVLKGLFDQLGAKAQARSAEFSWQQSADAMRTVLESVLAGDYVSGVL